MDKGIHHRSGNKGIHHRDLRPRKGKKEGFHGGGVYSFLPCKITFSTDNLENLCI